MNSTHQYSFGSQTTGASFPYNYHSVTFYIALLPFPSNPSQIQSRTFKATDLAEASRRHQLYYAAADTLWCAQRIVWWFGYTVYQTINLGSACTNPEHRCCLRTKAGMSNLGCLYIVVYSPLRHRHLWSPPIDFCSL